MPYRLPLLLMWLLAAIGIAGCTTKVVVQTVTVTVTPEPSLERHSSPGTATSITTLVPQATVSPTIPAVASPLPGALCDDASAYQRVRPSILLVLGDAGRSGISAGTGFAVGPTQVLTNAHVVEGTVRLTAVLPNGQRAAARLLRSDSNCDLAILDLGGVSLSPVTFGQETDLRPGQRLLALGFPRVEQLYGEPTLTSGILSAMREDGGIRYIQTDTAINPGNSGGPLFTPCGEVLGTVVARLRNSVGLNLAISLHDVKAFLNEASVVRTPGTAAMPTRPLPSAPTAETTVRAFYTLLQQRQYAQAYALLSSNNQRLGSYAQWVEGYRTTESIEIESVRQGAGPNLVNVSVVATDLLPSGRVTRRFAGEWQLIQEAGEWRLDVGRIQQVP